MSGCLPPITDDDDKGSTLSSPGRRRFRLRSSSWSALKAKIPCTVLPESRGSQSERGFGRKRKAKRSVTFEDILGSDEARQELSLSAKDKNRTTAHQEPASGEFRGHLKKFEENSLAPNHYEEHTLPHSGSARILHMRTVSQDDYLLARGANPRTGVVTPAHSLESSSDEQGTLQTGTAVGESKWRQKGDQWISLGLDQATPTESPPIRDLTVSLQHQIPRKPVGSPPRKDAHHRKRSSSLPTPRKFEYLRPSDLGKGLPIAPQKPFLEHLRPKEVFNAPRNGLQCPSTNSIPFQSPLSKQNRMKIHRGGCLPNQMPKTNGPRGGGLLYPCVRFQKPQIPPRHYHLVQDMQRAQTTDGPPRPLRHQGDVQVIHPHFHPRSLRGRISGQGDTMVQEGSHPQHAAKDIYATQPSTISMSTDTRIPSFPGNGRFRIEQNPSENMSLPTNRTKPPGVPRPQPAKRNDGMMHVSKGRPQERGLPQLSPTGMSDGTTDLGRTVPLFKPSKTNCRISSFEDKLHNMPGSIHTFGDLVEAEADIGDGTAASLVPTVRNHSQRTVRATLGVASCDSRPDGLEEITAACLEPLLVGLVGKLLEMGLCILRTIVKVLRMSYTYSETGNIKMEGMLVLDVLRSIIYAMILGAIAVALTKAVGLAVKVGTCILWVLRGVFWVLI